MGILRKIHDKLYHLQLQGKLNAGIYIRISCIAILVIATTFNALNKDPSDGLAEKIVFYDAIEAEISPNEDEKSKININNASLDDLDSLPGIGPSKAQNIIDYREEYGDFVVIDEIKEVKGIGDAIFNQIKEYICVE